MPPKAVLAERNDRGGRDLFEHYCAVCHGKAGGGDGINAAFLDPRPATLTGPDIVSRSDEELYEVIEKGGVGVDLAPTMPPWGKTFSRDQILRLVSYIRALQKGPPHPKGVRLSDIRKGEKELCVLCHMKASRSKQIAPDLYPVGSKLHREWLYQFLKRPGRIRPVGFIPLTKTRMPNFYFNDESAEALTEYLLTLKDERFSALVSFDRSPKAVSEGRFLFSDLYGCDGCHQTSDPETGGRVGPNLSIAAKRLRPGWIALWLKNPQAIRPDSPMPNFGLSDQEISHLMAYLFSLEDSPQQSPRPESAAAKALLIKKGKELVSQKNCLFCHILNPAGSAEPAEMAMAQAPSLQKTAQKR